MKTITYNPETHVLVPRGPLPLQLQEGSEIDLAEETPEAYQEFLRDIYLAMLAAAPQPERVDSEPVAVGWVSVDDKLPSTKPSSYMCEMSPPVLVRGEGKDKYPWVAHLHIDRAKSCKSYSWGFDRNGVRHTWLSPHRGIGDTQNITHWCPLPTGDLLTTQPDRTAELEAALMVAHESLDAIRFVVKPYDDIKPRDWKPDRANLRDAHQCAKQALAKINEVLHD